MDTKPDTTLTAAALQPLPVSTDADIRTRARALDPSGRRLWRDVGPLPASPTAMIQSIAFLTYAVSDIKAARHFYEDILGLKLTHQAGGEWFEYDVGDTALRPQIAGLTSRRPDNG